MRTLPTNYLVGKVFTRLTVVSTGEQFNQEFHDTNHKQII